MRRSMTGWLGDPTRIRTGGNGIVERLGGAWTEQRSDRVADTPEDTLELISEVFFELLPRTTYDKRNIKHALPGRPVPVK